MYRNTLSGLSISVLLLGFVFSGYAQQRRFEPSDLSRLERVGNRYSSFAVSPDGELLAFVIERPKSAPTPQLIESTIEEERSDIWLVSLRNYRTWKLTDGLPDGIGFFMPIWSPDGKYLAMASAGRGSDKVLVWDRKEGRLREVLNRAVNYWFSKEPSMGWFSETKLICAVRPKGRRPLGVEGQRLSAQIAAREWQKLWETGASTASVLDSGVDSSDALDSSGELIQVDILSGKVETLAQGAMRDLQLSPDRKYLAFLTQTRKFLPTATTSLNTRSFRRFGAFGYTPVVISQMGARVTSDALPLANADSLTWDNSGKRLAIVAEDEKSTDGALFTFVFNTESRKVQKAFGETVEGSNSVWTGESIAVQVKENSSSLTKGRSDWWSTKSDGNTTNLTAKFSSSPTRLVSLDGSTAVGISNGSLWKFPADGSGPTKFELGTATVNSITWPGDSFLSSKPRTKLILNTQNGTDSRFSLFDVASGSTKEFPVPDKEARIVGFDENKTAIMMANTRTGTYLWLSEAGNTSARLIHETNGFLRDVSEGRRQQIEYRSVDQKLLKGWVILPPDYEKEKRYPVVTSVYPGNVQTDTAPFDTRLNEPHPLNLQLYAAKGYVVLIPSIPLKPVGQASDTYSELVNGVLPAIDKLVELGIADPNRIAVRGQSWGGYATLALITQTRRFKAAIASAGLSDYFSMYGEFSEPRRYFEEPLELPRAMLDLEGLSSINLRLGNPPWKDFGLYLRNSPMFYVDKVETPVLLIHGDLDVLPIGQAEQFYSGLYRQGKRARFVRYWGEGHVIHSPQNIKDMWDKIYSWLDEFLRPTTSTHQ